MRKWKVHVANTRDEVRVSMDGKRVATISASKETFSRKSVIKFAKSLLNTLTRLSKADDSLRQEIRVILTELGIPDDRAEVKRLMTDLRGKGFTPHNIFQDKKQMKLLEKAVKSWVKKNYSSGDSLRQEVRAWFAEKGFSLERGEIKEIMNGLRKLKITPKNFTKKTREFNNAMGAWKKLLFAYTNAKKRSANLPLNEFIKIVQSKRAEQMTDPDAEPNVDTPAEVKDDVEEKIEDVDPVGTNEEVVAENKKLKRALTRQKEKHAIEIRARRGLAIVNEMIRTGALKDPNEDEVVEHVAEISKLSDEEITRLERKVSGIPEFESVQEAKKVARMYHRKERLATEKAIESDADGDEETAEEHDDIAQEAKDNAEYVESQIVVDEDGNEALVTDAAACDDKEAEDAEDDAADEDNEEASKNAEDTEDNEDAEDEGNEEATDDEDEDEEEAEDEDVIDEDDEDGEEATDDEDEDDEEAEDDEDEDSEEAEDEDNGDDEDTDEAKKTAKSKKGVKKLANKKGYIPGADVSVRTLESFWEKKRDN